MKLFSYSEDPQALLDYCERKVNNGLIGGTKYLNNVSLKFNPWLTSHIEVPFIKNDDIIKYGLPEESVFEKNILFFHPDFISKIKTFDNVVLGVPTSSSRTIRIPSLKGYLKLGYPKILGRVNKVMYDNDILSAIDSTKILTKIIDEGTVSEYLSIMPEKFGAITLYENEYFGYIFRSSHRITQSGRKTKYILPAFSLFGTDWESLNDDSAIGQLIINKIGIGSDPLNTLIYPIIDCYLKLLFFEGIQIEMHSQNFLIGLDINWNLSEIIIRDLESIEKDISIMKNNNKNFELLKCKYRCFDNDCNLYREKHSFKFDHKFCEFFLIPILNEIAKYENENVQLYIDSVKNYIKTHYQEYITSLFPKDYWVKFDDIYILNGIERRIYIVKTQPSFR